MESVLLLVAGAILGAIASVAAAVLFQDRWKATLDRRGRIRLARSIMRVPAESGGPISVAGTKTSVYLIEGEGQVVLEPQNVVINVRSVRAELPELVVAAREKVRRQLAASIRRSDQKVFSWNGTSMIALTDWKISRTSAREDPVVRLDTCLTDYATFAATVLQLDSEIEKIASEGSRVLTTLRREYFPTAVSVANSVRHPVPFLANGVGVMLLAFTDDNQVLLSRRHLESRARPGERDVSVVEGMDADIDSGGANRLNIYNTAVRGCQEELGVAVSQEDISLLGFAVDITYYQWNFLGLVETRHTANEVLGLQVLHAKDRWEGKLEPVKLVPEEIFDRLLRDKIWDLGLVTVYLALCKKCGFKSTRKAAETVFGYGNARSRWHHNA
jgi:hypothetical protein